MLLNYKPDYFVINPKNRNWGIGHIQSIVKSKVIVNFENIGKIVINSKEIFLEKVNKIE